MPLCWSPVRFDIARSSFIAFSRSFPRYASDHGIVDFSPFSVHFISTVRTTKSSISLKLPVVLFQNNHVLVVHKPPGWHSIPHTDGKVVDTSKCLLTYLCQQKLGGGSQKDYLKPLHRLDQPCSGLLLFGKTTKAASRIQPLFRKMSQSSSNADEDGPVAPVLQKTYYVMVHSSHTETQKFVPGPWQILHGGEVSRTHRDVRHSHYTLPQKGWSVPMVPLESSIPVAENESLPHRRILRRFSLRYRLVHTYTASNVLGGMNMTLLQIQTTQGARHLIRALLSCHQMIVVGDVRYGYKQRPVPDQSVALHARGLEFPPSFQLVKDDPTAGASQSPLPRKLQAPIPDSWREYFHCTQDLIDAWEERYPL